MRVAEVLTTYTIELVGPAGDPRGFLKPFPPRDWVDAIEEAEENLIDLLPEGYTVRIKEWDT